MIAGREEMTTAPLAGAIVQGAAIDTRRAGTRVAVPLEKLDGDNLVFRVACGDLEPLGIEHGDLLIIEPRPDGTAATAELVLVALHERAFVGRWWRKRGRRALLDHALAPIAEESRAPRARRGHGRRAGESHGADGGVQ